MQFQLVQKGIVLKFYQTCFIELFGQLNMNMIANAMGIYHVGKPHGSHGPLESRPRGLHCQLHNKQIDQCGCNNFSNRKRCYRCAKAREAKE